MRSKRTAKQWKRWLSGLGMTVIGMAGLLVTAEVCSAALHVPLPWEDQHAKAGVAAQGQKQVQGKQKEAQAKQKAGASGQVNGNGTGQSNAQVSGQANASASAAGATKQGGVATSATVSLPASAQVQVAAQSQEPELYNGCEVTSLSMLLSSAGQSVAKTALADAVRKDPTQEQQDDDGNTTYWGNPAQGFVGDVTGAERGYGVYHGPIHDLLEQYLPERAVDLTGDDFDMLLKTLAAGKPLVVWTTVTFTPPTAWVTWNSPSGQVRATFDEHACLLVGYDADTVTVIDPLDGQRKQVNRASFTQSWIAMGRQAVTYQ